MSPKPYQAAQQTANVFSLSGVLSSSALQGGRDEAHAVVAVQFCVDYVSVPRLWEDGSLLRDLPHGLLWPRVGMN